MPRSALAGDLRNVTIDLLCRGLMRVERVAARAFRSSLGSLSNPRGRVAAWRIAADAPNNFKC